MQNSNISTSRELPSSAKLLKSTIIAAITALLLLVMVVLPAEYGIDPTGVGNALGLKRMGEIKVSLAKEAAADEQSATLGPAVAKPIEPTRPESVAARSDTRQIQLAPDQGTEIKVVMTKGASVSYEWSTDGGKANFDVHGDSQKLKINYHNYEKGSEVSKQGVLVAAFDGSHGWFWRNRTSNTMTLTLTTRGDYSDIKHMK